MIRRTRHTSARARFSWERVGGEVVVPRFFWCGEKAGSWRRRDKRRTTYQSAEIAIHRTQMRRLERKERKIFVSVIWTQGRASIWCQNDSILHILGRTVVSDIIERINESSCARSTSSRLQSQIVLYRNSSPGESAVHASWRIIEKARTLTLDHCQQTSCIRARRAALQFSQVISLPAFSKVDCKASVDIPDPAGYHSSDNVAEKGRVAYLAECPTPVGRQRTPKPESAILASPRRM